MGQCSLSVRGWWFMFWRFETRGGFCKGSPSQPALETFARTPRGPRSRSSAAPLNLNLRFREGGRLGVGCSVYSPRGAVRCAVSFARAPEVNMWAKTIAKEKTPLGVKTRARPVG